VPRSVSQTLKIFLKRELPSYKRQYRSHSIWSNNTQKNHTSPKTEVWLIYYFAECRNLMTQVVNVILLNVVLLNVSLLNVFLLNIILRGILVSVIFHSVALLNRILANVVLQSVIELNVILLNVPQLNVILMNVILQRIIMCNNSDLCCSGDCYFTECHSAYYSAECLFCMPF
jgi:hypothetical protein